MFDLASGTANGTLFGGVINFIAVDGSFTPVPLPAAAWLLGSGLLGLLGICRSRPPG